MNFLRWWTTGVMLMGATMTLNLGVVSCLYWIYIDATPEMRTELPAVMFSVVLFFGMAVLGLIAFIPLRRNNGWIWQTQFLLIAGTTTIGFIFWRILSR